MEATSGPVPLLPPLPEDPGYDRIGMLPVNIFYPNQLYSKDRPRISNRLFDFEGIQSDAKRIICNWIDAYEQINPAFDLYFLATMGTQPSSASTFLALVRGLEVYHRRTSDKSNQTEMDEGEFDVLLNKLIKQCPSERKEWLKIKLRYGNEISLRKRIKELIEPFKNHLGNKDRRKKFINKIVDTRNYLTHYDPDLESKAAKGDDLQILCQKMKALFQLHFLQLIGFSQELINSIADHQLKWELQL